MTAITDYPAEPATAEPERHPKGLSVLFLTEMWERFSYYGMRALLVLYLVNSLHYEREHALALYGTYTALVYLTPIAGGYLADRFLGRRKAILIGGLTMALGHFAMAFEPLLYLALGLLIIGNGFFKPNISTLLGTLYRPNDARRDGGFTIFYMGVNLGAFLAPLVAGTLGEKVGWHYGLRVGRRRHGVRPRAVRARPAQAAGPGPAARQGPARRRRLAAHRADLGADDPARLSRALRRGRARTGVDGARRDGSADARRRDLRDPVVRGVARAGRGPASSR